MRLSSLMLGSGTCLNVVTSGSVDCKPLAIKPLSHGPESLTPNEL